jgi:hypothetical protein
MQPTTDTQLHEQARKRVEFRRHLATYGVINAMLWLIWFATGQGYPWPVWPMAGWGIGVIFHYLFDYRSSRLFSEEEEYRKLKSETETPEHVHQ